MTVKKIKDEQDKKIASLTQELETTRQMKKDSSARRLSETEQIKSRMEQDKDNTKIMLQTLTQELQNNEKQITAEREKSKKLNDQVLSLKDEK
jgi:chromosome segregation ATPase